MENANRDVDSDGISVNSKLKPPKTEPNTMDSFQDGGQQNMNMDRNQNDYMSGMDSSHMNSDMNNYSQDPGDQSMGSDNYGKMNDNPPTSQMMGYNSTYNRGNYGMGDQHGGLSVSSSSAFPQQNNQYPQYGQQNMRPGFPHMVRPGQLPGRTVMSGGGIGMMPQNYNPNQQRMMTGASIQQQSGPTPTLNQLLQNANSNQRYQGGYDYSMNQKGSPDVASNPGYDSSGQSWGSQHRPGMTPYQSMPGNQQYRNQGAGMYDGGGRRPTGMPGYAGSPVQGDAMSPNPQGQYGGSGQYSPNSQRYNSMQGAGQPRPGMSMGGASSPYHGQQQPMSPHYGGQHNSPMNYSSSGNGPPQASTTPTPTSSAPTSQATPPTSTAPPPSSSSSQPGESPRPKSTTPTPQMQENSNSQDGCGSSGEDSSDVRDRATPTSSSLSHPALSSLRPVPSPGGQSSRSNTPASISGNRAGSPMPPRPPSAHVEGQQNRIQSPMATQGYNQQMMPPPPMGPQQMNYQQGSNKMMGHAGMMGSSGPMGPGGYPQHNSQYPNQPPGFQRNQSGMPGYQQNSMYNGPTSMSTNSMYSGPNMMGSRGNMPNSNYPNYPQPNTSQYNNYNNSTTIPPNQSVSTSGGMHGQSAMPGQAAAGPPSSMHSQGPPTSSSPSASNLNPMQQMNNMANMGQASQGGAATTPKGAQAAAQAAMLAAASTATRPGYMRQGQGSPPAASSGNDMTSSDSMTSSNSGGPPMTSPSQQGPQQRNMYPGQYPQQGNNYPGGMNQMPNNTGGMPHSMDGMNQGPPGYMGPGMGPHMGRQGNMPPSSNMGGNMPPNSMSNSMSGHQPGMGNNMPPSSMGNNMGPNSMMNNNMGPPMMPPPPGGPNNMPGMMPNTVQGGGPPHMGMGGMGQQQPGRAGTPQGDMNMSGAPPPSSAGRMEGDQRQAVSSAGDTTTSVTQSITSPLTSSATTSQSGSTPVMTTDTMPPPPSSANSQSGDSNQGSDGIPATNGIMSEDSQDRKLKQDSHASTPHSIVPSPTSMSSVHDDFENISSPSWPGTPGITQHKESREKAGGNEGVYRLFDMGDEPERKQFLDKLFAYNEEKGTPICAMPMISKQPIDLYKLYVLVKEKGGLLEVTKSKKWRDICTAINIGSSGSAGFTLRKNYVKLIFPFECKNDLGGIDPTPILAQLDSMSQKKSDRPSKNPSSGGGSQQDQFRPPSGQNYDGYGPRPMGMDMQGNMMPPPNSSMGYDNNMMGNNQSMPPNTSVMPNQGMMPSSNMPNAQGNMMNNAGNTLAHRMVPNQTNNMSAQDPFADNTNMGNNSYQQRPGMNSQLPPYSNNMQNSYGSGYNNRPNYPSNQGDQYNDPYRRSGSQGQYPDGQSNSQYGGYGSQMDNRYDNQQQTPSGGMMANQGMRPPSQPGMGGNQDSMYPGQRYGNQMSGSRPHTPDQYGPQGGNYQGGRPYPNNGGSGDRGQWGQQRYPPHSGSSYGSSGMSQQMPPSSSSVPPYMYQQLRTRMSPQRPEKGAYFSPPKSGQKSQSHGSHSAYKKDISFPADSIEATQPLLNKRKRMTAKDIIPVDIWKVLMSLKSGQLAESTWALDTLNVLLFDDNTIPYFNLLHLPGLVEILLEHFRRCLIAVFGEAFQELELTTPEQKLLLDRKRKAVLTDDNSLDLNTSIQSLRSVEFSKLDDTFEQVKCSDKKPEDAANDKEVDEKDREEAMNMIKEEDKSDEEGKSEEEEDEDDDDEDDESMEDDAEEDEEEDSPMESLPFELPDPERLAHPKNYTLKTRQGRKVTFEKRSVDSDVLFDEKEWDVHVGFDSRGTDWEIGKGDVTSHILLHFEKKDSLQFYRRKFYGRHIHAAKRRKVRKVETDNNDEKENELPKVDGAEALCENSSKTNTNGQITELQIKQETDSNCEVSKTNCSEVKENCIDSLPVPEVQIKIEPSDTVEENCPSKINTDTSLLKENSHESQKVEDINGPCEKEVKLENDTARLIEAKDSKQSDNTERKTEDEKLTVKCEQEKNEEDAIQTEENTSWQEIQDVFLAKLQCNDSNSVDLNNLKRKWEQDEEETEAYQHDEPPLYMGVEAHEEMSRRCICISNIFRSLSFVPTNDAELAKNRGLVLVLGKLLLLHHRHPKRRREPRRFEKEDTDVALHEEKDLEEESREEWWWDTLDALRENTLVVLSNISGQLNMASYPEQICMPILDGLLHWAVCPSAYAQDPMPTMSANSVLSPQRLVLETLCKLCIFESNVDLLLATPPFSRIVKLFSTLVNLLADRKEQVMREFAIVLLSSLVQGNGSAARAIALQHPSISLLIDFLESAEHQAMQIANSHGVDMLRDNPEMMGTSLDMLRRAATTLRHIAMVQQNRSLFVRQQDRLLQLVMSHILDQNVAAVLSDVLFYCSQS